MPLTAAGGDDDDESFVSAALGGKSSTRVAPPLPNVVRLRAQLQEASRAAVASAARADGGLRCASPSRSLDGRLLLLLGVPSYGEAAKRRAAARSSWMRHAAAPAPSSAPPEALSAGPLGVSVVACFLLSAHEPAAAMAKMLLPECVSPPLPPNHGSCLIKC